MWVLTYKVIHLANLILRPVHHVKASALLLEPTRRWGKSLGPSKWFTRLWQRNCQNGTLGKHSKIVFRHVQTRHYIHIRPSLVRVNYYLSPFNLRPCMAMLKRFCYQSYHQTGVTSCTVIIYPWCFTIFTGFHHCCPSGPPGCNWHNCSQPMPWRFQNKM